MSCNECGEKPKKACGVFPKAVIEIDNPEKIVLLRKVMVPASMGDESTFPPTIGKYHNVLLEYEASGGIYLYSSDGIPTKLSSDVTELQAQLNALMVRVGEEEVARADADTALSDRITSLDDSLATVARTGSYNDLSDKPTIGNGTLTIKKNSSNVGTFTANSTTNTDVNIVVPTKTSDLANDGSDGASQYVESNDLATVATSGSYNDLTNKPTIGDATLTIKRNDTNVGTFTANATTNKSINIAVPTKTSDLTNDGADGTSTYVESDDLPTVDTTYSSSSNNAIANSTVTNSLDRNVMTNLAVDSTPSTTTVNLSNTKTNLAYPSSSTTSSISLPVASSTQAGVMNSATFDAVTNNTNNINAILNGAVAISNLPASPTQAQLTTAWENETGLTSLINRASVYDVTNNKVWTYYTNDQTWHAASNTSQVTVNTFTNSSEGTIKGSTNDGQVFAENDGTGSVNGWDTLTSAVSSNTSKLATIAQGAEVNVQANWTQTNTNADDYIKNKPANLVQDANYVHTDNNFTTTLKNKLDGIESGAEVNVQADWAQTDTTADDYIKNKPTIPTVNNATLTIQKNGTNVQTFTANSSTNKTANITVPTAVSELTNDSGYATTTQLNSGLATKQDTLTAGNNIQINGNTISATDTTYTAGNAIDITNGEISADIYPADFFTAEDAVSDCGSDLSLDDTIASTLKSVELKGDTYQQTYSGKNLVDFANASLTGVNSGSGVNNNGVYTVNANTNDVWGGVRVIAQVEGNTTYTFSATVASTTASTGSILFIPRLTSETGQQIESNKAKSGERAVVTFTTPSDLTDADIRFLPFEANATATYTDIMLEKSSTATSYEPYAGGIPAPNPDYPQAVQTVTGEQTVAVTGKNLFDKDNANILVSYFDSSVTTITADSRNHTIFIPCLSNTTYTVSKLASPSPRSIGYTEVIPTNGVQVYGITNIARDGTTGTITTGASAKYLVVRLWSSSQDTNTTLEQMLKSVQVEQGSTATDYQPYQSQSYPISLGSTELCKLGDYQDYIYKGADGWYLHKACGKFVFDGTENWQSNPNSTSAFNISRPSTIKTGETNMLSNQFSKFETSLARITDYGIVIGGSLNVKNINITNGDVTEFKSWLNSSNLIIYYPLITPTDIQIIDETLVRQLEALAEAKSYNGQTEILVTAAGNNLPATLCVEAYRKSLSGVIGSINENACTCGEKATHLVLSNPTTATWSGIGGIATVYPTSASVSIDTFASTDVVFTKDDSTTMTVGDLYTALTNGESFEIDLPFGEINNTCYHGSDEAATVATVENAKLDGSSKQTLDQTSQGRLSEMYTSSVPVAVILPVPGGVLLDERFGVEHLMIDDGDTMASSYRFVVNTYSYHEPLN